MLPTLRRMPFPGPAKEQRATHHIIQVGNDEKKSQRKGKIRDERTKLFFLRNNCTDRKLRARHTKSGSESKARERERERDKKNNRLCWLETTWTDNEGVRKERASFFLPRMQARVNFLFQTFYTLYFSLFFSLAWSKGWRGRVGTCVCVACA